MSARDLLVEDAENRERALALRSFIVEAPAGAGKTELLTQRYLKLLSTVDAPEEIIAITFTNKAAAEMRNRVLQSLQEAADDVPVDAPHKARTRCLALAALQRSAAHGWDLLAQPGRLRINTIDSLCGLLARQMPLLSRFGSQPAVSEDATVHYREAARRTLAMLEDEADDGPITRALHHFDNDVTRLAGLLADMLARRDQWLEHVGRFATQHDMEVALRRLVHHDMMRAAEALTPQLQHALMPVARYAAANLPCEHPIALLADWEAVLPTHCDALPLWRSVCELLLTQAGEPRKSVNVKQGFPAGEASKPYKAMLEEVLDALRDWPALARIRSLPDARYDEAEREVLVALAHLLHLAAAHLWTVFQEAGEVDFVEVAQRALQALEDEAGPTDLALRLDYRIRHLLVDEFQDTSPAQVRLLEKLTAGWEAGDGRTLFCVGDPMQSIYRFRKADVGLFLQVARYGIGPLRLERLQLTRNNRSCPAVVDWVNHAFARIFPEHDSETRGAIRYRPFAATRDEQNGDGVWVHPLVGNWDNGEAAAQEARVVADLIAQERERFPERKIAVLVRARPHLEALVAEIRRNRPGLSFQAVEVEPLADRQAVQDAVVLIRALLHRADRVHWLALLRAPWCGLRLADLHALAADDHQATVWQLMQDDDRLARLSADGRQRLLHVRTVLADAFAHRGRQPLRRWLESVWMHLGGPQCLWETDDVRDVQTLFDLVETLDASGHFDPDRLEEAMAQLYAAPAVADGCPQFMTIHKSKGLEFDTVILPGLHREPRSQDAPLLLWEEVAIDDNAPQLIAAAWVPRHKRTALPSAYDYLRGLEAERTANEAARVLYVAATRAKRRLHLVGVIKPDAKGERRPSANCFLGLLWPVVGAEFLAAPCAETPPTAGRDDEAHFVPRLLRLPHPAVPPILAESRAGEVPQQCEPMPQAAESVAGLDADCGTLAHLYLEIIARDGLMAWPPERLPLLLPAMQRWLGQRGHAAVDAGRGAQRVAAVLQATLLSEDGRWVLRERPGALSEYALTTMEGGRLATHVIDRTFVEDGVRWVVDYKSARWDEGGDTTQLARLAERYRPQLERYARLFAEEGLPVRKGVFFLACGKLVVLP